MSGEGKMKSGACSSDEGLLVLDESGLHELRNLFKYGDSPRDERKQQMIEALKKIGLFWFMRTVWKWQKMEICKEFLLNWDPLARKTVVNNTGIDVSLQSFAMVTGLLAEESATTVAEDTKHGNKSEACTARSVMNQEGTDSRRGIDVIDDPVCRDLMFLLMKTVWMKASACEPKRFPLDLLTSVEEALRGKRIRWSQFLYNKFACEMGRLHSNSPRKHTSHASLRTQRTVAGPLMCFLYVHAKLKAEALADLSGPILHDNERMDAILGHPKQIDAPKVEDDPSSEVTEQKNQSKQLQIRAFQSPVKAAESAAKGDQRNIVPETPVKADQRSNVYQDSPTPKRRRKLFHGDEASVTLPGGAPVPEDMAAKVLELEYIIARQNAELAECRLRLYAEESRMGRERIS